MAPKHKTTVEVVTEVKEMFDLDVGLFFIVGTGSGTVRNGRHEFLAADYRLLAGYSVAWAIEVRDVVTGCQVYRVNIMR